MSSFKSHIDSLGTYKPPLDGRDPQQFELLDFNERTTPVSSLITDDLVAWIQSGRMQMYPSYGNITGSIARYAGVDAANVMITNGSDQGIDMVFRACCEPGSEVIIPAPSFPMYAQSASIENAVIKEPHYDFDTGYPLAEALAMISDKTRVIVVSNPNNPSGTMLSREGVVALADAAPMAVILVDECYYEYCGESVCDLVELHTNIIVTRTFSKTWGMPSLRIGYVIAAQENIEALLKVRGPYDINQLAVVAVESALRHQETVTNYIDEVMSKSKPVLEAFLSAQAIRYWPSVANFVWVFFDSPTYIEKQLRDAGILVRPKVDQMGVLGLRITLGTLAQTELLVGVLERCVAKSR